MAKDAGYIYLTLRFAPEGDVWTAHCEELGTSAFGDDLDEAKEAIHEAIVLKLNALERNGARKAFFAEHGIRVHRGARPARPRAKEVAVRHGEVVSRVAADLPVASTV